MNEVIGEREFQLHMENGVFDSVKVIIYKPYQVADDEDTWKCEWEVQKPARIIKRHGEGIDSLQALRIGIEMLKLEIDNFRIEYKGRLTFLEQDRLWL